MTSQPATKAVISSRPVLRFICETARPGTTRPAPGWAPTLGWHMLSSSNACAVAPLASAANEALNLNFVPRTEESPAAPFSFARSITIRLHGNCAPNVQAAIVSIMHALARATTGVGISSYRRRVANAENVCEAVIVGNCVNSDQIRSEITPRQ